MVTRRFVIHITWAAALLLFAGALVYHGVGSEVAANYAAGREFAAPGGHSSADGCTGGSGSRPSLREAMDRADANWRKTVAARNEMIAKDWKSVEEMET